MAGIGFVCLVACILTVVFKIVRFLLVDLKAAKEEVAEVLQKKNECFRARGVEWSLADNGKVRPDDAAMLRSNSEIC